jgi:nitrite reductase/ring-hydroxylating ferredoxin subunit
MAKVTVGKVSEIPKGKMTHVVTGDKDILVANINGKYYATSNTCTHQGAELHEGELNGNELTCPWHSSRWDVATGKLNWFPQKLESLGSYKVTIEGDAVYVEV